VGLEDSAHPTRSRSPDVAELLGLLDEELDRLPDRYRGPLVACFLQAKTQDEAAREFGWSVSTLRRRLVRGRELLKVRLTARGATLGAGLIAGAVCPAATAVPADLARSALDLAAVAWAGGPVDPNLLALVSEGPRMGFKIATAAAGLLAACGVALALADSKTPAAPAASTAALAPVPQPSPWVTIKGRIVLKQAEMPTPKAINVVRDKEHCLAKGGLFEEDVIANLKNRGLKNVWAYLRPDDDSVAVIPKTSIHPGLLNPKPVDHVVDQPCCQFVPRVFAARAGDTAIFKNSAPVAHNVHLEGGIENQSFNVMTPPAQQHKAAGLKAERSPLIVRCDIHPWMRCLFMVFDHPYYAVTDDDGRFEIKLAPAGKWRLMYRHENGYHKGRAGAKGFPVTVKDAGGGTMEMEALEFEFPKPKPD
jgi:hypothetical protein